MLKTNSKKARGNVRSYLNDNAEYVRECIAYDGGKCEDVDDILNYIRADFYRVMEREIQRGMNYQQAFSSYASGLPLGGIFDYHLHTAVDTLGDILEETDAERERYSESDAERVLDYLIFREAKII